MAERSKVAGKVQVTLRLNDDLSEWVDSEIERLKPLEVSRQAFLTALIKNAMTVAIADKGRAKR